MHVKTSTIKVEILLVFAFNTFFHFLLIVQLLNDLFEDCAYVAQDRFVRSAISDFDILLVVAQFRVFDEFPVKIFHSMCVCRNILASCFDAREIRVQHTL